MTTLVFADSHTNTKTMAVVVEKVWPEIVINLGDHIVDATGQVYRAPIVFIDSIQDKKYDEPNGY